jgi:hypothetical protein
MAAGLDQRAVQRLQPRKTAYDVVATCDGTAEDSTHRACTPTESIAGAMW